MFPLPLTPFEHYYWCDDRPEYPTAFAMNLEFEGTPRRDLLEEALREVLPRHPLLQAYIDPDHRPRPAWVPAPGQVPTIVWSRGTAPVPIGERVHIDLKQSTGLRIWIHEDEGHCRVRILFHHACCDALGATGFVEDWFAAYRSRIEGRPTAELLPPLDPQRLLRRGDFGLTEANYRPTLTDAWHTLRLWSGLLSRQPTVLEPAPGKQATNGHLQTAPEVLVHTLDQRQTRSFRRIAAAAEANVNDVLLRDLFLTLDQWHVQHGRARRRPWRVTMPTALRSKLDRQMPAANLLGYTFLSRHPRELNDPHELLRTIGRETADIRRYRLGLYFLGGLGIASRFPRFFRWRLQRPWSFASVVFSNLGRVGVRSRLRGRDGRLYCGDLVLNRMIGAPPIRPGTRAAFAAYQYGEHTLITLRCDPHYFTPEDSERLLCLYTDRLKATIDQGA